MTSGMLQSHIDFKTNKQMKCKADYRVQFWNTCNLTKLHDLKTRIVFVLMSIPRHFLNILTKNASQ